MNENRPSCDVAGHLWAERRTGATCAHCGLFWPATAAYLNHEADDEPERQPCPFCDGTGWQDCGTISMECPECVDGMS